MENQKAQFKNRKNRKHNKWGIKGTSKWGKMGEHGQVHLFHFFCFFFLFFFFLPPFLPLYFAFVFFGFCWFAFCFFHCFFSFVLSFFSRLLILRISNGLVNTTAIINHLHMVLLGFPHYRMPYDPHISQFPMRNDPQLDWGLQPVGIQARL